MEDEVEAKERDDETGSGSEDFEVEGEYEEEVPTAGYGACETRSRRDSAQQAVKSTVAKSEEEEEHPFGKVTSLEAAAVDLVMMVYELLAVPARRRMVAALEMFQQAEGQKEKIMRKVEDEKKKKNLGKKNTRDVEGGASSSSKSLPQGDRERNKGGIGAECTTAGNC